MNRSQIIVALSMGIAAIAPLAANAAYRYVDAAEVRYDYARVLDVDPIVDHTSRPVTKETCWREPTTYSAPSRTYYDDDGRHESAVTISDRTIVGGDEEHCRTVTDLRATDRVLGYDVTYRYGGHVYRTRLDYDPGDHLRVRVNMKYDYGVAPDDEEP